MSTDVRNADTDRIFADVIKRLDGDLCGDTSDPRADVLELLQEYVHDDAFYCVACLAYGSSYCPTGEHAADGSWFKPGDPTLGAYETFHLMHGYMWAMSRLQGSDHVTAIRAADVFCAELTDIFAASGVNVRNELTVPPSETKSKSLGF